MLRKIMFALAAILLLGAGSVATTTEASARGGHGGGHGFHGGGHGFHGGGFRGGFRGGGFHRGGFRGGWHGGGWHRGWHGGGWHRGWRRGWYGPRFYAPRFYGGYRCYVRRLVPTPWGFRYRLINRCY